MNWVDWIIIAVVVYYVIDGWERGFFSLLAQLVSFLTALWLAIRFHGQVGNFLVEKFGLPAAWTNVLGYLIVALVAEILLIEVIAILVTKLPKKLLVSKINRYTGGLVSAVNALIIVAFFLLLILALPLKGTIKQEVRESTVGKTLIILAERYGGKVKSSLDEITQEAVKFLTIAPKSTERLALDIVPARVAFTLDEAGETDMLRRVNQERERAGMPPLVLDTTMRQVAREKSLDMFERRYFSHYDDAGRDAGDRLKAAGVRFTYAGENLAYAPDVATAHQGLMDSQKHRENILDANFQRIGIGVIDGGIYGKMFTMLFAD